jgi:5-hydroxyisourate hydrolase
MSLSTHVLDTAAGRPAQGIAVRLERSGEAGWAQVAAGVTDDDGRLQDWVPEFPHGVYRLVFDTGAYLGDDAFFPEVVVTFAVTAGGHYHVPLLLSPYGYSTYRGS